MTTSILWFRRDLRLHDHPALLAAAEADRLAPLFVLDDALLDGDVAPNRVWFMLETLRELAADLAARGSRLYVRRGRPAEVVPAFAREVAAERVHVSRDFTPYGRQRDERVAGLLGDGVAFRRHTGVLVHEPEALATQDGRHYTVYSPFRRAWDRLELRELADAPDGLPPPPSAGAADPDDGLAAVAIQPTAAIDLLPAPGEAAARARLGRWLERGIAGYGASRDQLADEGGTSRLSQDLRFGLLSAAEVAGRSLGAGEWDPLESTCRHASLSIL